MKMTKYLQGDYIRATDVPRPMRVTISEVKEEEVGHDKEVCPVVYFNEGKRGLCLNRTNLAFLVSQFGDDSSAWLGRQVVIFNDLSVSYNGRQGGTRIRMPAEPPAARRATQPPPEPAPETAEWEGDPSLDSPDQGSAPF